MPDRCEKCQRQIEGAVVTFQNKTFHDNCFVCSQCRKNLHGRKIKIYEGRFYDEHCYATYYAKKCAFCRGALTDGFAVTFEGDEYHDRCFVCFGCRRSLAEERFSIREGRKYCPLCVDD